MKIILFENVSKKINSTYRPTDGVERDVLLKEPCDFLNPVFQLKDTNWAFTNVYAWGMYYRVTNRVSITNEIQELHCKVDSLATAKDYISAYTCFVERSASQYTEYVDDVNVSVGGNIVNKGHTNAGMIYDSFHPDNPHFDIDGCFLIRVIAPPPATISSPGVSTGIVSYTIERGELYKLLNYAFDSSHFNDVLVDATIKAVFNPIDYLIDIKWLPIDASTLANNSTSDYVPLGWWTTDAVGYPVITRKGQDYALADPTYEISFELETPKYYTDFRLLSSRFSKSYMYIPGVGSIDVDSSELLRDFKVTYSVDRITGDAFAEVYTGSISHHGWTMIGKYSAQLSCKINLAQASVDMQGVVSNIASGFANVGAGNYVTSGFQLVDAINRVVHPSTRTIGENGSMGTLYWALFDGLSIFVDSYASCDQPNTCGKPLYKNVSLGNLSGFVKCGNASLSTPFLEPINEEVNQLLNSGFYME